MTFALPAMATATAEWFQHEGPSLGLDVEVVPPVHAMPRLRISSRAVRAALACGDLDAGAGPAGPALFDVRPGDRGRSSWAGSWDFPPPTCDWGGAARR